MNKSVQQWLEELPAAPENAVQRLVLGQAAVTAWARASLREIFIEIHQTHAEVLDNALTGWLRGSLLGMPPERTPTVVWTSHLQDVFRAITGLPLTQVARLLRDRLQDFRIWLRPLAENESLDPEAAYLAALAWSETNVHLEGMWRGIVLRRNHEPAYYTDIGLLGLRRSSDEQGRLPAKAPFPLLATVIDLADANISKKDWLLTTRALLGGYRCSPETWVSEFEPVLAARPQAQNGPRWLRQILPLPQVRRSIPNASAATLPTLLECNAMIAEVSRHGTQTHGLKDFLERHRIYANTTGDPHFLVRTFNSLAEKARLHDPDWAIARAEEALAWDKNNARNWTVLARCLWTRGLRAELAAEAEADCQEALDTLWTARVRFPWDVFVRTELARMYRDAGQLETAEAIYREAMDEFPQEVFCRSGLGEVLVLRENFEEAEAVFRDAIRDIPDQEPRNSLAAFLKNRGRLPEAEAIYRETCARFQRDAYCHAGLAEILFHRSAANNDEVEREEARSLFQKAVDLRSSYARFRLNGFDQHWQRLASQSEEQPVPEQQPTPEESVTLAPVPPAKMRPAQRLGRAILLQWQARRATAAEERERLFAEADMLLDLPDELTGECSAAFVETRGFLLLARERFAEARDFFEKQLATLPRPSLGLRLGLAEARARLGEPLSATDEEELSSFGPKGSILPLVLKVIRLLEITTADTELRDLLLRLYPRVRELAGMPPEGEEDEVAETPSQPRQPATPDSMIARLLVVKVFTPAAIQSASDLQLAETLPRLRATLKEHRSEIFSVAEKFAVAA